MTYPDGVPVVDNVQYLPHIWTGNMASLEAQKARSKIEIGPVGRKCLRAGSRFTIMALEAPRCVRAAAG